ncbi:DUF1365 domain-containing protein [uncultured Thiothrix sp.]|uniref:DUF1365 domain-containing protein n=1 Tax=uncultured Thiothrix sp. TaxID=223185 RepID=UPI00261420E8|nr:DUF1365 domain-containing protein [uncultured Thiothrix sp.]HMT93987.1 DUF1365 domain-containing protein [Thiolinea sp.]
MNALNSCLYSGMVGHCRYQPTLHRFTYSIFLFALDLDELNSLPNLGWWFKVKRAALMSFHPSDYLGHQPELTRQTVWQKVASLGGNNLDGRVVFVGQVRCWGFYFSPVNFYYCHAANGELHYLLAEVSNTPWNERHCYLIDARSQAPIPKVFHVSPFMDLQMHYHWRFSALDEVLSLQITNQAEERLFDASLRLERKPLTAAELKAQWLRIPAMTIKTVASIYWQALKLYWKKVPYVPHPTPSKESNV